jgi:hypothetical protein
MTITVPLWAVEIHFDDPGTYRRDVYAATAELAFQQALIDARMASCAGAFFGKVLKHKVTLKLN